MARPQQRWPGAQSLQHSIYERRLITQIAREHCLADQRHSFEQKLDDVFARPRSQRFRPIELRTIVSELGQDAYHRAGVPWLRVECGQPDELFGIDLLRGRLLGALT